MKSFILLSLATVSAVSATWSNPLNLFERDLSRRSTKAHASPRPSPSMHHPKPPPTPPTPVKYSLTLPAEEDLFLACPAAGFQQAVTETIFYDEALIRVRCTTLSAGGGSSYCDYDGQTGLLIGRSYEIGDVADYCKGTETTKKDTNYECNTVCTGPKPFTYAVVDIMENRLICFFNTTNTNGVEVNGGCSYNAQTGQPIAADNAGTNGCGDVSAEYGTCVATLM